ncbi:MAG TPA: sulfotransferase [Bacteroidia bacterium]|nr:sulfotransferase [Bacteroidia bacterium]
MIAQLNKDYIFTRPLKVFPRLLSCFFYEGRPATTKGRWFNPVTFMALRNNSKAKHDTNCESPVFITGTGRSGSTILGMVLSMHKDVGFLNEPKALWFHANPNDDLIGSYTAADARYRMSENDASDQIANTVKSIYSSYLNFSGTKRIVDKFPEMIFRIEYLNKIFKNPKFIFLYRNPWDTIASTALWSETHRNENKHEDWWGVNNRKWNLLLEQIIPYDPSLAKYQEIISSFKKESDKAAVEWITTMNFGINKMLLFPKQIIPVRYEDLAMDPIKSLQLICEFTDLDRDETFLNFGKKILRPAPGNKKIQIHPVLSTAIDELSERLGYLSHSPSISVTE